MEAATAATAAAATTAAAAAAPPATHRLRPAWGTLQRFTLYETPSRFYLVGSDVRQTRFRVLKIDRSTPKEMSVMLDPVTHSKRTLLQLLGTLKAANERFGVVARDIAGLLGAVRFTQHYYLVLAVSCQSAGVAGTHSIHQLTEVRLLPLATERERSWFQREDAEAHYTRLFYGLNPQDFYFSYTYDMTRSLQYNIAGGGRADNEAGRRGSKPDDLYLWNMFLLRETAGGAARGGDVDEQVGVLLCAGMALPLVCGYVAHQRIAVFGRSLSLLLIARRSRHFAGTRYRKRGINNMGRVANDVETEQILEECGGGAGKRASDSLLTSFVQVRGSIPMFWSQQTSISDPRPDITLSTFDVFYRATQLHFQDLMSRYATPVVCLNLIRKVEKRRKRETKLGEAFSEAVEYLNKQLPPGREVEYIAWDFKDRGVNSQQGGAEAPDAMLRGNDTVVDELGALAEALVCKTGMFVSKSSGRTPASLQRGVVRTNCIDSLDRTNVAQFCIGKCVLGQQMHALSANDSSRLHRSDNDALIVALVDMYEDMGNHIALQYGGSEAHATALASMKGQAAVVSKTGDMLTSFRRYYSNTFTDAEKQHAINLYLGNFVPYTAFDPSLRDYARFHLWDLESDYYLHNKDGAWNDLVNAEGARWWEKALSHHDQTMSVAPSAPLRIADAEDEEHDAHDTNFSESYRPELLTSFDALLERACLATGEYSIVIDGVAAGDAEATAKFLEDEEGEDMWNLNAELETAGGHEDSLTAPLNLRNMATFSAYTDFVRDPMERWNEQAESSSDINSFYDVYMGNLGSLMARPSEAQSENEVLYEEHLQAEREGASLVESFYEEHLQAHRHQKLADEASSIYYNALSASLFV